MKFKVGDRVKATMDCSGAIKGNIYTVKMEDGKLVIPTKWRGDDCYCDESESWKIVKPLRKERVMKTKKIESISIDKKENGWIIEVGYEGLSTKSYIAKNLGKFITKLTK